MTYEDDIKKADKQTRQKRASGGQAASLVQRFPVERSLGQESRCSIRSAQIGQL